MAHKGPESEAEYAAFDQIGEEDKRDYHSPTLAELVPRDQRGDGVRVKLTRDEVVVIAQAVEEFRDEFSGPHVTTNRELADRLRTVLAQSGDTFALSPEDSDG